MSENDTLFRTPEGEPVLVENFELVHRQGKFAQTNMTG